MTTIRGTVENGRVILDLPSALPNGSRVQVELINRIGLREDEWEDTPEAIAEWLRWYDTLEPLESTAADEAEWEAERTSRKEAETAAFEERADQLQAIQR